jgi:hypothetical protein
VIPSESASGRSLTSGPVADRRLSLLGLLVAIIPPAAALVAYEWVRDLPFQLDDY